MKTKIAALYRLHNIELMDYPLVESIESMLNFCDEVVLAVGDNSSDKTVEIAKSLQSKYSKDRVKLTLYPFKFDREWQVRAWDKAKELTDCEWLFLIDADEAIHEDDGPKIRELIESIHEKPQRGLINFPAIITACGVAIKVFVGMMTSSPLLIPLAIRSRYKA